MTQITPTLLLTILLAPLLGSLIAGLLGKKIGQKAVSWITILLIGASLAGSLWLAKLVVINGLHYDKTLYNWAVVEQFKLPVGFLVDHLTVYMLIVVNFVSILVHIYSIGYMRGDPGYTRFFSYISGFTFAMLSLVMSNNFLLLFFGWEGVGLVSYLLIGFWFKKESANFASLKAFIANRVGDLGFLLGIAAVVMYFGSFSYTPVFNAMPDFAAQHATMHIFGQHWSVVTVMCILLFIGAMGKSAQIPLHIWLEGSMEGPTPISALIHAATMVTAGVYMVARLSPMFEHSVVALSTVLIIGSATCFFMGILGVVQTDIKRVIAYSTLSQLGYMVAAEGVSAYSFGLFHLMTHAAFKALLFLSAGSVIVALHHEQDMRYMGGLRKYMPVTYICMLIGALALAAVPPFAGFYSKDLIIEAVTHSTMPGHAWASFFVVGGAFVTALYTFRMFFMVFHGKERMTEEMRAHVKESPLSILVPLILLAIPAVVAGYYFFEPSLHGFFGKAVYVLPQHDVVSQFAVDYHSPLQFLKHGLHTLPFWLAIAGIVVTWVCYVLCPSIPAKLAKNFAWIHRFLVQKYWVEPAFEAFFPWLAQKLGRLFWRVGDVWIIDRFLVEGSAFTVKLTGLVTRRLQSGYLYHYAFVMLAGVVVMMACFFW